MKLLSKLAMLCSLVIIFPCFALSMDVTELVNKAKDREAQNENKISSYVMVQTLQKNDDPKQIEATYYKKGVKTRSDTSLMNKGRQITMITIFDGKDNWTITDQMKKKLTPKAADKSKEVSENQKLSEFLKKNCKIERMGKFEGRDCYVVSAKVTGASSGGGKVLIWIDKDNYNTYQKLVYDNQGKEIIKTTFSDFRKIYEGVTVPFRTDIFEQGKLLSRSTVKSYKVNQKLSDDLFDASKFNVPDLGVLMKNLDGRKKALKGLK